MFDLHSHVFGLQSHVFDLHSHVFDDLHSRVLQAGSRENEYETASGVGFPRVASLRSWENIAVRRICVSDTGCYTVYKSNQSRISTKGVIWK